MMTHGFTAWPSDSSLGGGGYVDLSGTKNAPIETKKDDKPSPIPPMVPTVVDWVKQMTIGQIIETSVKYFGGSPGGAMADAMVHGAGFVEVSHGLIRHFPAEEIWL